MSGMNAKVDVRRERRCLTPHEFGLFLKAARNGTPKRNLTGEDRGMLYLLAASTGFRCSELSSLSPESFDLESDSPSVTVGAAYSKHRRQDAQPMPRDVASVLGEWLRGKPAQQRLWPGGWVNHAAKLVKEDLAVARSAWLRDSATQEERQNREASAVLAFRDEAGHVFDFHSLRHQYVSSLAAAGVHPKIAQTLARHSTINLTLDRYTHVGLYDLFASVNSLSTLSVVEGSDTGVLRATGTEGEASCEVPTVVPRGAENGAILLASPVIQVALVILVQSGPTP
jgi:integrase